MANSVRGEIDSDLFGEPLTFCLTLGALAEIETAFSGARFVGIVERVTTGALAIHDLILILGAAARGGGARLSNDDLSRRPMVGGLERAYRLVGDLLATCFEPDDAERQS